MKYVTRWLVFCPWAACKGKPRVVGSQTEAETCCRRACQECHRHGLDAYPLKG